MSDNSNSLLERIIGFFLHNKLIVVLLLLTIIIAGVLTAPFNWQIPGVERYPVPVDAIPDIGENQQIVFSEWKGHSPQDIEDQISYPLTVALLGIPEIKTVRSFSMFGFSTIYIIFKEQAEFYWTRSRVLEKLNSLPDNTLPDGVQPVLGPDATALGQVFWYTLEGRDEQGNPIGGWDLQELRTIQDWYVRYSLQSADGIAEVASIGGFVKEYQIDVDPAALKAYNISLQQVYAAVKNSNLDVGAKTVEINRVEYVIRGVGQIETLDDLRRTAVASRNNRPIYIEDIAKVSFGPATRRGILDKGGAEVVGGVVVVRYGDNPLQAIQNVKEKIKEISPGLPSKKLDDGRISNVQIVPFYDRSGLIYETLNTLNHALRDEIIITMVVILIMIMHLRTSIMIAGLLPLTVLLVFFGMKVFGVDANIVALSGIAIAIGTIVDMGIVMSENILNKIRQAPPEASLITTIRDASVEVGGAVITAVATTVISFLPVFTMSGAEGKLFKPLAYTKTLALVATILITITVLPAIAHLFYKKRKEHKFSLLTQIIITAIIAVTLSIIWKWWLGIAAIAFQVYRYFYKNATSAWKSRLEIILNWTFIVLLAFLLSGNWAPLGYDEGIAKNFLFVVLVLTFVLGLIRGFIHFYPNILKWILDHKKTFLVLPGLILFFGFIVWIGSDKLTSHLPKFIQKAEPVSRLTHVFPGLGKEFMPLLDEGSFLYMPTTMPHAGVTEAADVLKTIDLALLSVPEVESVVGKIGRAETPLDPAPLSMIETVVNYKSEYILDENGNRKTFAVDASGQFLHDNKNELIPDKKGKPYRQWRNHIRTNQDIWDELVKAAKIPGTTSAPKLQPISARIVMLQSGMRAPMGLKVKGPDLKTIEQTGETIEKLLKQVPSINPETVIADRIIGKPYLEIEIDRQAIARYGLSIQQVQSVIEIAIGGMPITTVIEGRERYPVRVRYMRELRDNYEGLSEILVPVSPQKQIPLGQLAQIQYVRGPQMIKSEDTFLTGYVLFDKNEGQAEVDVVEDAQQFLADKIKDGELILPAGVSYQFAGSYQNQIRATNVLKLILPISLLVIFFILYLQFKKIPVTLIVFSGIIISWAGGFIMLWLYAQDWFLNFSLFGQNLQTIFQLHPINLSVAVWVGFLALFGVASDDGVIISTFLEQQFDKRKPNSVQKIREATIEAGKRRIWPAMMTISTTILALIPVLTSTGRGSDIMTPMAIPLFGGMSIGIITTFVVPVLYSAFAEFQLNKSNQNKNEE